MVNMFSPLYYLVGMTCWLKNFKARSKKILESIGSVECVAFQEHHSPLPTVVSQKRSQANLGNYYDFFLDRRSLSAGITEDSASVRLTTEGSA